MPLHVITVRPLQLQPGDEILGAGDTPTGVFVDEIWNDPEGPWLNTSDGDAGGVSPGTRFRVARVFDE